jgi:hypothetical protein
VSRHRQNEDDHLTPPTIEELAESERADQRRTGHPWRTMFAAHRPVVFAAALSGVLAVGLVGWAIARPEEAPKPLVAQSPTAGIVDYVEAFGNRPDAATPSPIPVGKPAPRPSGSPTGAQPTQQPTPLSSASGRSAPVLPSMTKVSLRSVAATELYVYAPDSYGQLERLDSGSTQSRRTDATFSVVQGLADPACFSLRDQDGRYLRHADYRIRLHSDDGSALFRADATFCAQPGSATGSVLLQSHNYPGYYLHGRGSELWIDRWQDSSDFRRACSFLPVNPLG